MKNTLLIMALVSSIGAFAQIEKGTKTIGGTGGFGMGASSAGLDFFQLKISPEVGHFLKKNWMIQSQFSLGYTGINLAGNYEFKTQSYGAGFGLSTRYYVPLTERMMLFGELGLQANTQMMKRTDGMGQSSSSNNGIFIQNFAQVGVSHFLTENLAMEVGIKYTSPGFANQISMGGLTIPVGIKYYFGRKKK